MNKESLNTFQVFICLVFHVIDFIKHFGFFIWCLDLVGLDFKIVDCTEIQSSQDK